jgi:hypothetical protein
MLEVRGSVGVVSAAMGLFLGRLFRQKMQHAG